MVLLSRAQKREWLNSPGRAQTGIQKQGSWEEGGLLNSFCEEDGECAMETSVGEPLGRENKENRHRSVVLGLALGPSGIYFPSTLLHHNLIVWATPQF